MSGETKVCDGASGVLELVLAELPDAGCSGESITFELTRESNVSDFVSMGFSVVPPFRKFEIRSVTDSICVLSCAAGWDMEGKGIDGFCAGCCGLKYDVGCIPPGWFCATAGCEGIYCCACVG